MDSIPWVRCASGNVYLKKRLLLTSVPDVDFLVGHLSSFVKDPIAARARTDLKLSWKLGDAEALLFNLQLRAGSPFGNIVVTQKKRGSRNLSKMWIL